MDFYGHLPYVLRHVKMLHWGYRFTDLFRCDFLTLFFLSYFLFPCESRWRLFSSAFIFFQRRVSCFWSAWSFIVSVSKINTNILSAPEDKISRDVFLPVQRDCACFVDTLACLLTFRSGTAYRHYAADSVKHLVFKVQVAMRVIRSV